MTEKKYNTELTKPILITFGDVFTYSKDSSLRYVIVNIGDGNNPYCDAVAIQEKEGQEALGIPGTTYRSDIGNIIGRWSLDRIINASMVYYEQSEPIGEVFNLLKQYSRKSPRILPVA